MKPLNPQERQRKSPVVHSSKIGNRESREYNVRQDGGGDGQRPQYQRPNQYQDSRTNFKFRQPPGGDFARTNRNGGVCRPPRNAHWVRNDDRRDDNGRRDAQSWAHSNERGRSPAVHNNHNRFSESGRKNFNNYNNESGPRNNSGRFTFNDKKREDVQSSNRRVNSDSSAGEAYWDWEAASDNRQPTSMSHRVTPPRDIQRMDSSPRRTAPPRSSSSGNARHEFSPYPENGTSTRTHRPSNFPRYNPDYRRNNKGDRYWRSFETSQNSQPFQTKMRQGRFLSAGSAETKNYTDTSTLRSTAAYPTGVIQPPVNFHPIASATTSTAGAEEPPHPYPSIKTEPSDDAMYKQNQDDNYKHDYTHRRTLEFRRGEFGRRQDLKKPEDKRLGWKDEYNRSKRGFPDHPKNKAWLEKKTIEPKTIVKTEPTTIIKTEAKSPKIDDSIVKMERNSPYYKSPAGYPNGNETPGEMMRDYYMRSGYTPSSTPFYDFSAETRYNVAEAEGNANLSTGHTNPNKTPVYSETEDPCDNTTFQLSSEEKTSGTHKLQTEKKWKPPLLIDLSRKSNSAMKRTHESLESTESISSVRDPRLQSRYAEKYASNTGKQLESTNLHHSRFAEERELIPGVPTDPRLRHPSYKQRIPQQPPNFPLKVEMKHDISASVLTKRTLAEHEHHLQIQPRREHVVNPGLPRQMSDQSGSRDVNKRVRTNQPEKYSQFEGREKKKDDEAHGSNFDHRQGIEGENNGEMTVAKPPKPYVEPHPLDGTRCSRYTPCHCTSSFKERFRKSMIWPSIYTDEPLVITDEEILEVFPHVAEDLDDTGMDELPIRQRHDRLRGRILMAAWLRFKTVMLSTVADVRQMMKNCDRIEAEYARYNKERWEEIHRKMRAGMSTYKYD